MTGRTLYEVRQAGDGDTRTVLDVLTEAFLDDPVTCWLFPKPEERRRLQVLFANSLLTHGPVETHLVADRAVAVWQFLERGQEPFAEQPDGSGEELLTTVFGTNTSRMTVLGRSLTERHPRSEPHLYLVAIGVHPERQGTGIGSVLLRHGLSRADVEGLPAYLEASSPRSRALYARHGFVDLGAPIRLPDGPPVWPMWRPPAR